MPVRSAPTLLAALLCCRVAVSARAAGPPLWVSSTADAPWATRQLPAPTADPGEKAADVRLDPSKPFQTIDGFGGCFNELGWTALGRVAPADRDAALRALFGPDGCGFTLGRLPVGASDFAADGYSLDDTPGDTAMAHFSIDRDRRALLPFVKAALALEPGLRCWASPWSPPAWMKTNGRYDGGRLRSEPRVRRAYADYLCRWLDAYAAEGVAVYAVTPQNEPNVTSDYPTCEWTGDQLRRFIADDLGPLLKARHPAVGLWLGLNGDPIGQGDNPNARLLPVLDDAKANAMLTGVAFQYDSRSQIALAHTLYPDKKLMQSETECGRGANSWADAMHTYRLLRQYLDNGANAYFAWNMVLDQTGTSTWKWKQNALITADTQTGRVRLNGEYYVMRHFSRYVRPGARRIASTGVWGDQIGFVNADGSVVLVAANSAERALPLRVTIAGDPGGPLDLTLPAGSVNTFVFPAAPAGWPVKSTP